MKRFLLVLVVSILCITAGCATSISKFKPSSDQQISPVGLYVIVPGKGSGEEEAAYCREITRIAEAKINSIFLNKGYRTQTLNTVIPAKEVYTYVPGIIWHVDEGKIAKYARQNGCNTVLVAQYYLDNFIFDNWLDLHKNQQMVLRVWLVDTENAKALTENRHIYACKNNSIFANVTGWINPDMSATGKLHLTSDKKTQLMYQWRAYRGRSMSSFF